MTLLELTEPIFQYVCQLNRVARAANQMCSVAETSVRSKANVMDFDSTRRKVNTLLDVFLRTSRTDSRLIPLARKAETLLVLFIDDIIAQSKLGFVAKWRDNWLAQERNKLSSEEPKSPGEKKSPDAQKAAGDQKFIELLESTIRAVDDGDKDMLELLPVFYICIGLGYTGSKPNNPDYWHKCMEDLASYITPMIATNSAGNMAHNRITPKAYDHTDTAILSEAPSTIVKLIGVLFVCFALAVGGFYVSMYRGASKALQQSLLEIKNVGTQK
ncbi:MAG: hypothetical protein WCO56_11400 [Verrucomicrobiota bacterium]